MWNPFSAGTVDLCASEFTSSLHSDTLAVRLALVRRITCSGTDNIQLSIQRTHATSAPRFALFSLNRSPCLSNSCLGDKQVRKVLDRHLLEGLLVGDELEDLFDVRAVKVRLDVALKLGLEERRALLATALVADGVVDVDFGEDGAVVEGDGEGVRDEALLCRGGPCARVRYSCSGGLNREGLHTRVVVVGGELLVLDTLHLRKVSTPRSRVSNSVNPSELAWTTHLGTELVDARVGGDLVRVVLGRETAKDERDGDHVLDRVVAVGKVVQRARLVNDADLLASDSLTLATLCSEGGVGESERGERRTAAS